MTGPLLLLDDIRDYFLLYILIVLSDFSESSALKVFPAAIFLEGWIFTRWSHDKA